MRLERRAAISLSVNFMVMLIIAIIIFGIGLVFFFKQILPGMEGIYENLDESTKSSILSTLMNSPDPVIIPFNHEEIRRGDHHTFGVGIRNDLGTDSTFSLTAVCVGGEDDDGEVICSGSADCSSHCGDWPKVIDGTDIAIKNNDRVVHNLYIIVPKSAAPGDYIFNVEVKYSSGEGIGTYDTIKKAYVTVK